MKLGFGLGTLPFSTTYRTYSVSTSQQLLQFSHQTTSSSGNFLLSKALFGFIHLISFFWLFYFYMQWERTWFLVCKTFIIIIIKFTHYLLLLPWWLHRRMKFHQLTQICTQILNPIPLVFWRFQIFTLSTGSNLEIQLAMWVLVCL